VSIVRQVAVFRRSPKPGCPRSCRRHEEPRSGPAADVDGERTTRFPSAIANAAYKRQKHNPSVSEIKKMPNRGHSLTIDHGWQEVAQDRPRLRQAVRPANPG
jgi:hypothetical protein